MSSFPRIAKLHWVLLLTVVRCTYDVIIVGGGLAGLQALKSLTDAGSLRVLLIEARDRVGGRIFTDSVTIGTEVLPVDVGGQWVGVAHKRLIRLCEEFNLSLIKQKYVDQQPMDGCARFIDIAGVETSLTGGPSSAASRAELDAFCEWIDGTETDAMSQSSLAELDAMSLEQLMELELQSESARNEITELTLASLCVHPRDLSALGFIAEMRGAGGINAQGDGEGSSQEWTVQGGVGQVATGLLEKCKKRGEVQVLTGHVLRNLTMIEEEEGGEQNVQLVVEDRKTGNKKTLVARRTIIAMAPTLFRDIPMEPPAPKVYRDLWKGFVRANVVKIICVFEKPFWMTEDGKAVDAPLLELDSENMVRSVYLAKVGKHPALVLLISGHYALGYDYLAPDTRKQTVLQELYSMYGLPQDNRPQPLAYVEKNWTTEEFSGGCFGAVMGPTKDSVFAKNGHLLRKPLPGGSVFFAGTETANAFTGFMEGALESGERAAADVLLSLKPQTVATDETVSLPGRANKRPLPDLVGGTNRKRIDSKCDQLEQPKARLRSGSLSNCGTLETSLSHLLPLEFSIGSF